MDLGQIGWVGWGRLGRAFWLEGIWGSDRVGRYHGAGWGQGFCASTPFPAPPGPPAPMGWGTRVWVSPRSPAGNPSPHASSFLLLPEACRAPPPCSRAPSLLFPSPGRLLLLLLLPFSLDLSLPARNPFRPGSRSGQAAVCSTPWPSGGPPSRASVCRCARLPTGPGERLPPLRGPPVPAGMGEPPPGTTVASDRRAAGSSCPPLQPPPPGPSRDPGAPGGRAGTCPARPFVVMPRGEGVGRGARGSCRRGDHPRLPLRLRAPREQEPGRTPGPGLGQI